MTPVYHVDSTHPQTKDRDTYPSVKRTLAVSRRRRESLSLSTLLLLLLLLILYALSTEESLGISAQFENYEKRRQTTGTEDGTETRSVFQDDAYFRCSEVHAPGYDRHFSLLKINRNISGI